MSKFNDLLEAIDDRAERWIKKPRKENLKSKIKTKILFLQPKKYFDDLGISIGDEIIADYGFYFSRDLPSKLSGYSAVITCIDQYDQYREICSVARSLKILTIFIMDGIFDLSNAIYNPNLISLKKTLFEVDCYDLFLTPSEKHKCYLNASGVEAILYTPKHAYLDASEVKKESNTILIATANTPYFNEHEKEIITKKINKLVESLALRNYKAIIRTGSQPIIKSIKKNFHAELKNQKISISKEKLSEDINRSECVVCTPSTLLQTCFNIRKKSICLNIRDAPTFIDGTIESSSVPEIIKFITYNDESINRQNYDLRQNITDYGYIIDNKLIRFFLKRKIDYKARENNKIIIFHTYLLHSAAVKMKSLRGGKLYRNIRRLITSLRAS